MLLSPVEQAYLSGTREFTKPQIRYIKCRLKKKLQRLDEQGCNAAALLQQLERGEQQHSCKRKAENLQPPQFFFDERRSRTTFSRLCKASAFLLQRVHWSKSKV
jgi:hypothetical protein